MKPIVVVVPAVVAAFLAVFSLRSPTSGVPASGVQGKGGTPISKAGTGHVEHVPLPAGSSGVHQWGGDPEVDNPHGALATWAGTGSADVADGRSPASDLVLKGAPDLPTVAEVRVRALFGAITADLLDERVLLDAGASEYLIVPLDQALALDPAQTDYSTTIEAHVNWWFDGATHPVYLPIDYRKLVFDPEDGLPTVVDMAEFWTEYPDGVVGEAAKIAVADREMVGAELPAEDGEVYVLASGAGPGTYRYTPIPD